MSQHSNSPTHWLEPRRQWERFRDNGSQFSVPPTKWTTKRQSGRADDEDGSPGRKFFGSLIHAAWIRRMGSDRMYLSIWKSMQLCLFIHLSWKRAKTTVLLDTGATENFIGMQYAKELWLPIKCLQWPWLVYNMDSTRNKNRDIEHYTDLKMQTGTQKRWLQFFLTDLADQKAILGYPWFAATQPKIDWAWGWIDSSQLPLILHTRRAIESRIGSCTHTPASQKKQPRWPTPISDPIYIAWVSMPSTSKKQTLASKLAEQAGTQMGSRNIPAKYHHHLQVFSKEASQWFPEPCIWDHAIELKPGAPSSILGKIYQLTQDEQKVLLDFIKEQQEKGYICPSKSPYAAPFFFIKKKDGKLQPVKDYWQLNEWTIKNCYLLPLISELISWVQGAKQFSKVNIRWGYNNICIKEGDEHKAAFITNQGLFEPTVMFFGLTNSPATFQMMMNTIFAEEIAEGWLIVYMDNILVATKDNPQFHEECIHWMLEKLKKHDLYLKLEKCIFDQHRIEFLGIILENRTVQMDPVKVKGVADWSPPQNIIDVHSFLGFTGFYHYFIPNYSLIAWPLIQLTQKNVPFKWEPTCMCAFEHLKSLMCLKPILWQPNYTKAFFLATDASTYGVGTILLQEGELNPQTQKPMLCPVAYYSSMFTPTERNYDIYEREFLGVLKALKCFRPHVAAMEIPVTILTDHANLTHWKATRKVNRWVARWFAKIQDYNLIIKHVPGKIHTTPNMLSRPPGVNQGKQDNADIILLPPTMLIVTANTQDDMLKEKVREAQQKHKAEMELWCDTQGVRKLPEGYAKDCRLAVPSRLVLRQELMAQFHNTLTAGHPGCNQPGGMVRHRTPVSSRTGCDIIVEHSCVWWSPIHMK